MIFPQKLVFGDTIGLVSPSSQVATVCPKRLERGLDELKRRGFRVMLADNVLAKHNHLAGSMEQRVADLHQMFADEEVKAIMCTIGGTGSQQLLEFLDYDLIRSNPKILIGYSDVTALLTGIHVKTGMVTFSGPTLMPQFGEFGGIFDYSWDYFQKLLMQNLSVEIEASASWTDEYTPWEREDIRLRKTQPNPGIKVLRPGQAEGFLVGGNMGVLLNLAGTPYWPDMRGKILFLEDDEVETPATIDRYLTQFRQMGVFGQIKGLLTGRFHSKVGFSTEDSFEEILLRATRGFSLPIFTELDFGHTDPLLTIPLGGSCQMDSEKTRIVFNDFIA